MKHKKRNSIIALFVLLSAGAIWLALNPPDPRFRGLPESQWITNIAYGMSLTEAKNNEQIQRWRDFGPEGLRVLERGLAPSRAQIYRNIYNRLAKVLPRPVLNLFPTPGPKTTGGTRACVMDLLTRMEKNAWPAWPAAARALTDEDESVRQIAIVFFTSPEDDKAFLNQMSPRDKKKLLPDFIRALEDKGQNWGLRNNAALALKYYPEEASRVTPALVNALKDASPYVRVHAADALNRMDPAAGSKAGAVTVVAAELQNPDSNLSSQAALAMRQFQADADAAVTYLIEALEGTNRAVVGASAVWSLEWAFLDHTNRTIPALKKAAEIKDTAGSYARSAFKALEAGRVIVKRPK